MHKQEEPGCAAALFLMAKDCFNLAVKKEKDPDQTKEQFMFNKIMAILIMFVCVAAALGIIIFLSITN